MTDPQRRDGLPSELEDLPASVPAALRRRLGNGADPFLIGVDFRLTFAEAESKSAELAGRLLASGIGKGTRVGLLFANGTAWVVTWLALARIGALSVPLSNFAPGAELARTVRQTDIHALMMGATFGSERMATRLESGLTGLAGSPTDLQLEAAPFLRWIHVQGEQSLSWSRALPVPLPAPLVRAAESEVTPADALAIINTSGATAAPKSAVHTHGSLVRHAALMAQRRGLTRDDRIYSPMPFFWVGGLTMVLLAALVSGAAAVVQERFEPGEALDLIERQRVTQVSCWPNASRQMADHPTFAGRDLRSVRGGTLVEALPSEYRPPTSDRTPNVLGMTETGGPHTGPDDAYAVLPESLRGTMGRSLPGMEHIVVDADTGAELPVGVDGELLLRGRLFDGRVLQAGATRDVHAGRVVRHRRPGLVRGGRPPPLFWPPDGHDQDGRVQCVAGRGRVGLDGLACSARGVRVRGPGGGAAGRTWRLWWCRKAPAPSTSAALVASLRNVLSSYKIPRQVRVVEEK